VNSNLCVVVVNSDLCVVGTKCQSIIELSRQLCVVVIIELFRQLCFVVAQSVIIDEVVLHGWEGGGGGMGWIRNDDDDDEKEKTK